MTYSSNIDMLAGDYFTHVVKKQKGGIYAMYKFNRHGIRVLLDTNEYVNSKSDPSNAATHKRKPKKKLNASNIKGKAREEKFFQAFQGTGFKVPDFYVGMRRATEEEDKAGTDFFMQTTEGEIPFNVKSSRTTLNKHNQKKWAFPDYERIIGFIVKAEEHPGNIRRRAFTAAKGWRAEFLSIVEL